MEEQIEELKFKIQTYKEKGKDKKVEKYKKQLKELKKELKEQQEHEEKPKKKVKLSKDHIVVEQDNSSEVEVEEKKSKKNKKKKSKQIEIEEEEEQEKQPEKIEEEEEEEEEVQENQEQISEEEQKYEQIKEKILKLKAKLEKATEKEQEEKIKSLKQKIKALKKEKKQVQTDKINQEHKDIENLVKQQKNQNTENNSLQPSRKSSTQLQGPIKKTENVEDLITIVLFYQYIEPEWTHRRYKEALSFTQEVGKQLSLGGRLRVAYEGFNGTISGSYKNIRQFTEELKKWEPHSFNQTFFKFIDGLPLGTHFPKLKVFEVKELVNYGLHGNQPNIEQYGGVHLAPKDYHKKMEESNSVIIDVRNTYESIIGKFDPPDQSKCQWIDPKWRRSTEIVDWLKRKDTLDQLKGKQVLMYCTGGVRCERASAYIKKEIGDQVEGIFQLKGGIEQYMLEYPEGGYWKGKNYTFDKRFAITAYDQHNPNEEILSTCSGCDTPCDRYRGKKRCAACLVPILVCRTCHEQEADKKRGLRCTLCVEQNVMPKPKRVPIQHKQQTDLQPKQPLPNPDKVTRLFVGNLPFDTTEESIKSIFRPAKIKNIQWLKDKNTQKFYGSVFIDTETPECAGYCLAVAGRKLKGREVRVRFEAKKQ